MADKPITYSGPMVRAMFADLKTQTRRVLVLRKFGKFTEFGPSDTKGYDWCLRDVGMRWHDFTHARLLELLPYQAGDRLYVREHWRADTAYDGTKPSELSNRVALWFEADRATVGNGVKGKFRQAMHMPKWASRITLHVTEVRVQRLQDISEADCIAEGAKVIGHLDRLGAPLDGVMVETDQPHIGATPRAWYRELWGKLHGPASWDSNPWVAATTFEVEHCHINQARAAA